MARGTRVAGRRRRPAFLIAGLVVALILVGGGAYQLGWVGYWFGSDTPPEPPAEIEGPTPATPKIAAASSSQQLDAAAVRQVLTPRLNDPRLGKRMAAQVTPLSGDAALTRGSWMSTPASTTKLVTSAGALSALGPDHTFTTGVALDGNRLTLVGGGDPLLTRADYRALAQRTARALADEPGAPARFRLFYDDSLFGEQSIAPAWEDDYVPDEVVAPITSLMVDEGHTAGPDGVLHSEDDGRVSDSSGQTADVFAAALTSAGVRLRGEPQRAAERGETVAEVEGRSVARIVEYAIVHSANEPTEMLARQTGLAAGDPSFAGGAAAVEAALQPLGVSVDRMAVDDGSGLARTNQIAAPVLAQVIQLAASEKHPDLAAVLTGLPMAGFSGTGESRFLLDAEGGRGHARLKTGTLTGVHAYAGLVTDANDTPMVLVLMADRVSDIGALDARDALDDAAAALATCDCS